MLQDVKYTELTISFVHGDHTDAGLGLTEFGFQLI